MSAEERDAILAFLQHRDEASFLRLYRPHAPYLLRMALRLVGGRRADAEDSVQEAWLRATRTLAVFRGDAAFRTWLSAILINCCREMRRRPVFDELGTREEPSRNSELAVDLERVIEDLPDGYREVLVLHDLYGHTHAEIAALLEIDPGTSKSQLSRGRAALRKRWLREAEPVQEARR